MDQIGGSQMSLENTVQWLNEHKEKPQAISLLNTFAKYAWQYEEYDDIAKCFFKIKEYEAAMKYGELTYTTAYTNERRWSARANLINVYNHANYPEKALFYIKMQETTIPDDQDTRLEKAFAKFLMNDRDGAEAILREELLRDDLTPEVRTKIEFNLGTYHLWRDEFQTGLSLFLLKGEELNYWRKAKLPFKFWEGGIQPGKTIILFAEAGIGDEFINVRFAKHLKQFGMNPIWLTDRKDLATIFRRSGVEVITDRNELKKLDSPLWTYPMSLPVYLNLQYKDLWEGPYIAPIPTNKLPNNGRPKIGIRWQGNPAYDHDLHRSVPLKGIYEAVKHIDADFYSLQRDTGLEEMADFPGLIDMQDSMKTFDDTLSLINELDVVISSCTSVLQASAAIGKTTCGLIPISAYYTWSHSCERSPWYGENLTLFRQNAPRVWDAPLAELSKKIGDIIETNHK
jgi:hypothetical protein